MSVDDLGTTDSGWVVGNWHTGPALKQLPSGVYVPITIWVRQRKRTWTHRYRVTSVTYHCHLECPAGYGDSGGGACTIINATPYGDNIPEYVKYKGMIHQVHTHIDSIDDREDRWSQEQWDVSAYPPWFSRSIDMKHAGIGGVPQAGKAPIHLPGLVEGDRIAVGRRPSKKLGRLLVNGIERPPGRLISTLELQSGINVFDLQHPEDSQKQAQILVDVKPAILGEFASSPSKLELTTERNGGTYELVVKNQSHSAQAVRAEPHQTPTGWIARLRESPIQVLEPGESRTMTLQLERQVGDAPGEGRLTFTVRLTPIALGCAAEAYAVLQLDVTEPRRDRRLHDLVLPDWGDLLAARS